MLVTGAVLADVSRLWSIGPGPWTSLLGAGVSVTGLTLAVWRTHRPWRELLADAFLISGATVLAGLATVTLITPVTDNAQITVDVACLTAAALAMQVVPRLTRSVAVTSLVDQRLTFAYFATRLVMWVIVVTDCLGITAIGMRVAQVIGIAGLVMLVAVSVHQRTRPVPPVMSHQEVPQRLLPFVLTAIAALVTGVGMAFDRRLATASIILMTFAVAIVTVARQIVTWTALRRAVQDAREREEYFRALVQDASDVIAIAAPTGALEYVSPAVGHTRHGDRAPATARHGRGPGGSRPRTLRGGGRPPRRRGDGADRRDARRSRLRSVAARAWRPRAHVAA